MVKVILKPGYHRVSVDSVQTHKGRRYVSGHVIDAVGVRVGKFVAWVKCPVSFPRVRLGDIVRVYTNAFDVAYVDEIEGVCHD